MTKLKLIRRTKEWILGIFTAVLLLGVAYTILAPVIGIVSLSFMSGDDIFNPTVFLIPSQPSLYNISNALRLMNYWVTLSRTLIYAMGVALLHVLVASFVGYGFARFKFYGNNVIFALVIFTIIVPAQAYIVPLFMQFRFFGPTDISLIDSYASIIILTSVGLGLRSGLFIYIFRQFFKGLPFEISEAAYIDGAGPLRTYATVMLPNAKPAITTVLLLALVWLYGDTLYTGILMPGTRLIYQSTHGLFEAYRDQFRSTDEINIRAQMVVYAGVLMIITPMLVIYAALQRQFVEGVERSGITG